MPEENYCPGIQGGKKLFSLVAICIAMSLLTIHFHSFYRPRSPSTDLTRVTSGEVQHVEEEAQLTCQAELLLAKVVLD